MKRISSVIFVIFILYVSSIGIVSAQTRLIGVKQGDTFVYDTNNTSTSSFDAYQKMAKIRQETIHVSGIQMGSQFEYIVYTESSLFEDGHTENSTGFAYPEELNICFFGANLNAGDQLFPSSVNPKIKETIVRNFPEGTRELNHFTSSSSEETYDIYFDKKTGVFVDASITIKFQDNTMFTQHWVLKESNVWAVPEFPSLLILSGLMVAVPLIAIAYRKRTTLPRH